MTQRKFQDGEEVVRKSDKTHRMTVVAYTGEGRVICRWKEKVGFKSEEFMETELAKWVDAPQADKRPKAGVFWLGKPRG